MVKRRSQYHPIHRFDLDEVEPDPPEGKWGVTIPRGKCVVRPTEDSYPCYPMLIVHVRLDRTEEDGEDFEKALGIELSVSIVLGGINNRAARESKIRLKQLCEAAGVDLDLVPKKLTQAERDLDPLIRALEGKKFTAWTRLATHGDEDVELLFQKPPEQTRKTAPPFLQITAHPMSDGDEGYALWGLDVDGRLWFRWTGDSGDGAGWSLTDNYVEES